MGFWLKHTFTPSLTVIHTDTHTQRQSLSNWKMTHGCDSPYILYLRWAILLAQSLCRAYWCIFLHTLLILIHGEYLQCVLQLSGVCLWDHVTERSATATTPPVYCSISVKKWLSTGGPWADCGLSNCPIWPETEFQNKHHIIIFDGHIFISFHLSVWPPKILYIAGYPDCKVSLAGSVVLSSHTFLLNKHTHTHTLSNEKQSVLPCCLSLFVVKGIFLHYSELLQVFHVCNIIG